MLTYSCVEAPIESRERKCRDVTAKRFLKYWWDSAWNTPASWREKWNAQSRELDNVALVLRVGSFDMSLYEKRRRLTSHKWMCWTSRVHNGVVLQKHKHMRHDAGYIISGKYVATWDVYQHCDNKQNKYFLIKKFRSNYENIYVPKPVIVRRIL